MAEWAHLKEIVVLINSKLFVDDIERCRQVCRTWEAALAESPYLRLPYLMLFHKPTSKWRFHQHTQSFDVKLPLPNNAVIRSSNYGWLLMQQSRRLFFFDPFNRRTINIGKSKTPSFPALYFFNPPTSQECFVVGIKSSTIDLTAKTVKIGILKLGEPHHWETHSYDSEFDVAPSPPVLRGGLLYFLDLEGNVATLDVHHIHTSWTLHTECLPLRLEKHDHLSQITHHYLFHIKGDEALYAVFLIHDVETVNVFRLSEPAMKWESVKNLGDKMVYLSPASCFGVAAHTPTMANTIFFPIFHNHDMLYYSLTTRRYHSLRGDYSHDDDTHGLRKYNVGVAWILPAPDTPAPADAAADSTQQS